MPEPRTRGITHRRLAANPFLLRILSSIERDFPNRQFSQVQLFTAKRTDESIVHFHEALRHKPGLMSAHFKLGIALELQQKTNEAVRAYREVLRWQPDSAPVRTRLRALGAEP